MPSIIDADTHIAESDAMWECIEREMYNRRPVLVKVPTDTWYGRRNAFWLIDGNILPKPAGKGGVLLITPSASDHEAGRTDIQIGSREMTNMTARLADMDRLGIDQQVVYPTLFLIYLTDDVNLEVALCRAYNRFLAKAAAEGNGRVFWTVIPPLHNLDESLRELRFGKENGAVGVFFRGIEGDRTLDDPYFFPLYEEAQRLNLPITIHTGAGCPAYTQVFSVERNTTFPQIRMQPLVAFRDLVGNKIPELFPTLRFGFIEAGVSWVPYVLHALKRWFEFAGWDPADWGPRLFREYRLYVACEADEDVPYLLQFTGEDNLIIGSDYGHNDPSEERELVAALRARSDIPAALTAKILDDNARRFYAL